MAEAQLDWSDFAARESGDFSIWTDITIYTAGIETAYIKGKFIGAERWYTDTQKIKASFSYEIEGSQSAKVNIDPMKDQYFIGDEDYIDCRLQRTQYVQWLERRKYRFGTQNRVGRRFGYNGSVYRNRLFGSMESRSVDKE